MKVRQLVARLNELNSDAEVRLGIDGELYVLDNYITEMDGEVILSDAGLVEDSDEDGEEDD